MITYRITNCNNLKLFPLLLSKKNSPFKGLFIAGKGAAQCIMSGCLPEQLKSAPVREISPVIAVRYPEMLETNVSRE